MQMDKDRIYRLSEITVNGDELRRIRDDLDEHLASGLALWRRVDQLINRGPPLQESKQMFLRILDKLNSLFSSKLFIVDIYVGENIVVVRYSQNVKPQGRRMPIFQPACKAGALTS